MKGGENRKIRKWGFFVNSGLGQPEYERGRCIEKHNASESVRLRKKMKIQTSSHKSIDRLTDMLN
jgi:hypothetical protein